MIGISNMTTKNLSDMESQNRLPPTKHLSEDSRVLSTLGTLGTLSGLWKEAVLNQNHALKKRLDTKIFDDFMSDVSSKTKLLDVFDVADEISGGMTDTAVQIQEETKYSGSYMPNNLLQKKLDEMHKHENQLIYAIEDYHWAFEFDGSDMDSMEKVFNQKPRSVVSASIFIALLSESTTKKRILSSLNNTSLDVDQHGDQHGDHYKMNFHALQSLNYTPGAVKVAELGYILPSSAISVDLSLPQARFSTKYNLKLLIDRALVSSLGPIASKTTGINYKLIQRMRSITMIPKTVSDLDALHAAHAAHAAHHEKDIIAGNKPVHYTTDNGQTYQDLFLNCNVVNSSDELNWQPFAGARPNLFAFNRINAALIIPQLDTDQGGEKLRLFETLTKGGVDKPISDGRVPNDIFTPIIVEEFESVCAKISPQSPPDLIKLFAKEAFFTELDFVYLALHRVGSLIRGQQLTSTQITVSKVTASLSDLSRELMLTQMVQTVKSAAELRGVLESAFRAHRWHSDFEVKGGLAKEFKKIYLGVTDKHIIYCSPPTIKLFDLGIIL